MYTRKAIIQSYEKCLNLARLWLNQNNYEVAPKDIVITAPSTGTSDVKVTTSDTLHFRGWPYRHDSRKTIDILATITEVISLETGTCQAATVCVSYFLIHGKKATAMESLHYDYELPPQTKQHPICHVQNSEAAVGKFPESFRYEEVDVEALGARCKNVRIPSAFVNLPGLFAILAADHMPEKHWREFMEYCLIHFTKVPAVPRNAFIYKGVPKERLCAWTWYDM